MIKSVILCFILLCQILLANWTGTLKGKKLDESIDFNEVPLREALFFISKETGINVVGDTSTENIILNIYFQKGTNYYQILEGINRTNGLKVKKIENLLILSKRISNIIDEKTLVGRIVDKNYGSGIDGAKVSFLNGDILPAYTLNGGYFIAEGLAPGIYLIKIERQGYLTEGELIEVKPQGEKVIIALERDLKNFKNSEAMPEIKNLKDQVRITAHILDVTDNLFEDLGFSWIYGPKREEKGNISVGIMEKGALESMGMVYPLSFNLVRTFNHGNDIFDLAVNLLQSTQDLVISAVPSILVLDGEEGEFKITEEVVAGQSRVHYDDERETVFTPIFKEAGIILRVRPVINDDGSILMGIKTEVSNFKLRKSIKEETTEINGGTFNELGGSKISRSVETVVRVGNGETIFIGGLKRATVQSMGSKMPFFGDIPALGMFFKNQMARNEVTDLFIKLKADIVGAYGVEDVDPRYFEKGNLHMKEREILNKERIYPKKK